MQLEPTPSRELAAVKRARALGTPGQVRRLRHGAYVVPSATDPRITYSVTGTGHRLADYTCSCPAGAHGRVCHHVAGVALRRATENALRELARLRRAASRPSASETSQDVAA